MSPILRTKDVRLVVGGEAAGLDGKPRKLGFGAEAATAYHMSTCWMQQPHKANMATKPRGTIVVALSEGLPPHMVTPPTTSAASRCADLAVRGRQRARRGAHVVDRGGILAVVVRPDPSPALGAVAQRALTPTWHSNGGLDLR